MQQVNILKERQEKNKETIFQAIKLLYILINNKFVFNNLYFYYS